MSRDRFSAYFHDWQEPWLFATPKETVGRMERAGFVDCQASLEPAPTTFDSAQAYPDFLEKVVVWPHLQRLQTAALRRAFVDALVARATYEGRFELDYWRLNISGTRAV